MNRHGQPQGACKTLAACRACAPAAKYDTSLMVSGDNQVRQAEKLTDAISAYLYSDKPGSESTGRGLKRIVRGL